MNELLLKLQNSLIESTSLVRHTVVRPAFTAMITLETEHPGYSYAVPTAPLSSEDVLDLCKIFEEMGKVPRLECFPSLWPDLGSALTSAGFRCEGEYPMMVLPRASWQGTTVSDLARLIRPEEGAIADRIAAIAFNTGDLMPTDGRATAASVQSGRMLCAIASREGQDVSTGFGIGDHAVREMAGIATLPEFQRRGAATDVLNCLLGKFFSDGGEVAWLSAGDDGAKAAYTKVGFVEAGVQANWSKPS